MAYDGLAYTSTPGDRAARLRTDPDWVAERLRAGDTRIIPMWRGRPLLTAGGQPATLTAVGDAHQTALLSVDGPTAVFAADLSDVEEAEAVRLAAAHSSTDLRALATTLPGPVLATLAYARGLLHWNRQTRFCGSCGGPTDSRHAGHLRLCRGCGRELFPRIEPAVIVLVERGDRCLLARHHGAGPDGFSLLAGFVEIGESLEGAVRRELAEEAGVTVGAVAYQGSQGWPFPAGLMVGFVATATSDAVTVDGAELVEARWFTRAEIVARIVDGPGSGPVDSIGGHLLRSWAGLCAPASADQQ
ncbi:NAD+ diphosphatase [Asanoa hainanensis]|uniref:NAD(+) diphosphatase n=1 Tax=Asanoa hainanensis TaxID=560556 RepID=A0A239H154_9ACTN|nr:NAD(+) diphosphatase [Asanoa hainanensis]SNS74912.1 NAD+ diphosphatase [Asanoa hainanensis]